MVNQQNFNSSNMPVFHKLILLDYSVTNIFSKCEALYLGSFISPTLEDNNIERGSCDATMARKVDSLKWRTFIRLPFQSNCGSCQNRLRIMDDDEGIPGGEEGAGTTRRYVLTGTVSQNKY